MQNDSLMLQAKDVLLQDAVRRDPTSARRFALLGLLWHERYLTRAQLIARVELKLARGCFGRAAWEDNFFRDMRVVKQAFEAAGYRLAYSRSHARPGYYLAGQPPLSAEIVQSLHGSMEEVDPRQIAIYRQLSAAERFRQGCAISDTARRVVAYRIQQEHPEMDAFEANRLALQRSYSS
jgi:hypothetical protein